MLITDVYERVKKGEEICFRDFENKPIKVKRIQKESYKGKIYDVTVPNHIILLKRKNSSAIRSGNSGTKVRELSWNENNSVVYAGTKSSQLVFTGWYARET